MSISSTQDLVLDALSKAGEKSDGTSEFQTTALSYMNTFYKKLVAGANEFNVDLGDPWTWAKAKYPGVFVLQPFYNTGTVTMTAGSANGVFNPAPSTSRQGDFLKISNLPEYFRITSHTAGQANFTIDVAYTDASGTYEFQSNPLDYNLDAANIVRLIGPMNVYRTQTRDANDQGKITGLDQISFERKNPFHKFLGGIPTEFAVIYNSVGLITVRVNKIVDVTTKVEYNYIPMPTDLVYSSTNFPIVPQVHSQVLSHATAYAILMDKEDDKAKHYFSLTQEDLKAMKNANQREFMQISRNRGRLIPRSDDFVRYNWPTSGIP